MSFSRLSFLTLNQFFWVLVLVLSSGCATTSKDTHNHQTEVLYSTHDERPSWTFGSESSNEEGNSLYFVGISGFEATEKTSREQARADALQNISNHVGTYIKSQQELTRTSEISDYQSFQRQVSESLISEYEPRNWYLRKVRKLSNNGPEIRWKAYVRLAIPEAVVDEAIKTRRKEIKERKNSIFAPDSVKPIQFRAEGNHAQRLNEWLQSKFTDAQLNLKHSDNPEPPYFLLETTMSWTDGGKVGGVMHSQKGNYRITLSAQSEGGESTQIETVTGTHAAVGSADRAARERAIKEIVQNHSSTFIEAIKNPEQD